MKLYDRYTSPNCQRTRVVLDEKYLAYETIPVDLQKKEQKRPEFLKMNPYGKVPVLVDGDIIVYESCIINEYLEEKYPDPPLLPEEPGLRSKIRILIDYGVNRTYPAYEKLRNEMLKPESERNSGTIAEASAELKSLLQRFEKEIGERPYLAGDFSLLDAAVIPRFLRIETWGPLADPSMPRLRGWLKRMRERPSVKRIIAAGMPEIHNRRVD
ncbi:MAG: glutathione S-transferase family protein [Candidatus Binatia bacterium]